VSTTLTSDVPEVPNPGVLFEIANERRQQDEKWGPQDHPSVALKSFQSRPWHQSERYEIPTAWRARDLLEKARADDELTWAHILIEEVAEAICNATSEADRRAELIQVAAVAVAWVEAIDRRMSGEV
jgi:hypothetical protein